MCCKFDADVARIIETYDLKTETFYLGQELVPFRHFGHHYNFWCRIWTYKDTNPQKPET
ncbi:hypothetical protein HYC85_027811 [Camellia sinensis]|uniref:Uncharacterized protein n=1 Tax=Camellia sinensis TaxID=4442 RepID=A0A7J7FTD1_CAMSI|nr:hypothetical protein HYC85_027811 [Camellia sinensis]